MQHLTVAPKFEFRFPATIDHFHDGDTCYVWRQIQPGPHFTYGEHVRVQGINAPELSTKAGPPSRDYATSICPPGTQVTLVCNEDDKYGRLLAHIILSDGSDFSQKMIAAGQAVPYMV